MPATIVIDSKLLLPVAVTTNYPEKYNQVPAEHLTPEGQEICSLFGQTIAPLTVLAEEGAYQKALTAYVYPVEEDSDSYILKWDRGIEIPLDDFKTKFGVNDAVNPPVAIVTVTVEDKKVSFPFKKEDPLKGGTGSTVSMGELEIGSYTLETVKLVKTKYGLKHVLSISKKEYWANSGTLDVLGIMGLLPHNEGETKALNMPMRVTSKDVTKAGKTVVRVAFN